VHHGKLFILLYLLCRAPEKAVAIDLFEDQHLNVDLSGNGDLAKFRRHLARHADDARLVLHQGNSMDLAGADLVRLAEGPLRFVSVDGGHTAEITAHDLAVADAALAEGGIIVLDDAFNEQWPGVADGVQVNSVLPGPVMTGRRRSYLEHWAPLHNMTVEQATANFPKEAGIARYGEPEEIAELMAFLVSPGARWMTGSTLRMDGGEVKSI